MDVDSERPARRVSISTWFISFSSRNPQFPNRIWYWVLPSSSLNLLSFNCSLSDETVPIVIYCTFSLY
ncbi:unnamed protein product [Citrullus colocynthis]|uniref:Uncharacterized protein n=1 Tax=Citrullus colocynthis TaxID=252529 RepID=A0ABP0YBI3_9ROSI